jgi:malate synthase
MAVSTFPFVEGADRVLTAPAVSFVEDLTRRFRPRIDELLARRRATQAHFNAGARPDFLAETAAVRRGDWKVGAIPADLRDRRVEITGPVDRKMIINALNSGAQVFMADFEDATSPTWANLVGGQANLMDAVRRTITYEQPETGKRYALTPPLATLMVRPRGFHLPERHFYVDGRPAPGMLVDFGLYLFHNAEALARAGTGPYFYLPKIQSHLEARVWNEIFLHAQAALKIPAGTIKVTVLVETLPAAFEMDEILFELKEHSAGLNCGRWDYIFSSIKTLRNDPGFVLPDRGQVTMDAPFLRSYTQLLIKTCHRRGAHAMGGMAAFIPSRRDPTVNATALAKVRDDKQRESGDGFDGSWVAHPDLVPVCREVFDAVLRDAPNQLGKLRDDVHVTAADLLSISQTPGQVTEAGLRNNISVGLQYLANWLAGTGAVAIFNLMEDAATAEISRSQVWQWLHNDVHLAEGPQITKDLVERLITEELAAIRAATGDAFDAAAYTEAVDLFSDVALADHYVEFLTLPAYEHMP